MLKVDFAIYKNILIAEILDMPKEYRNLNDRGGKVLSTMEGYAIKSISFPQLTEKTLYVRGCAKARDKGVLCYSYPTAKEATKARAMFEEMIRQINEERRKNESK